MTAPRVLTAIVMLCALAACSPDGQPVLTFSGSVVGSEGDVIRRQLERYQRLHPALRVTVRVTPDSADQRHQLYVQWLNASVAEPDILQLDTVWTPEFAAAGWLAPIEQQTDDFFPPALAAGRWRGVTYALPWFVDVGMLYWRTDLMAAAPRDLRELVRRAQARETDRTPLGFVWQGARYEGLITVFLEHLGAFGGAILDEDGRVVVDSPAAVRALTFMRDAVYEWRVVPPAVLTWHEEETRFAFQNRQALFMRNWPYAYAAMEDAAQSRVAGRFGVAAMPSAEGGTPTAALGGAALAVNAHSDQPDEARRLVAYLLAPEQMLERARVTGQYPSRPSLYQTRELADALPIAPEDARAIIERARPRPITPVYSELSEILQVAVHRALTRQQEPASALAGAAAAMRSLLTELKLEAAK